MFPLDIISTVRDRLGGEFEVIKEGFFHNANSFVLRKKGRKSIVYLLHSDGGSVNIRWYRRILKSRIPSKIIVSTPHGMYMFDKNYLRRQAARKMNRVKNIDGTCTLMFPLTEKQRWTK